MKKKDEMEVGEMIRAAVEIIWALIMTAFYIFRDVIDHFTQSPGKQLKGKHVLVTGGARGLGREICLLLGEEKCKVTVIDVNDCSETCSLAKQSGAISAEWHRCDITNRKAISDLIANLPPIDILINNAGIVSSASVLDSTQSHIETMFRVNVMAHFWTIQAVLPGMIERGGGHVVAIASAAAFTSAANIVPYAATKYAVTGLMASLHEELRLSHPKIQTTSVHPFFISPPPSSVEHWDKTSRLPDVTAAEVAKQTIQGIKRNKVTVTIPNYLYYLLHLLPLLPSSAGEMWRDIFPAKISALNQPNEKIIQAQ